VNKITAAISTLPQYGLFVNWGCSKLPVNALPGQKVLNKPEACALAKNKLLTFQKFKAAGVPHPEWWTNKNEIDRKSIIIARQSLTGSGGDGIVVIRPEDKEVANAPLYTRYIQKTAEYRLHVVNGRVIAVQQKRKDGEAEQTADQKLIRNHANGWNFAINNVTFANDEQRNQCEQAAVASVAALGLDFGAVDLVVSKKDPRPYVLEVNTAPGIESPTILEQYTNNFRTIHQGITYVAPKQRVTKVGRPRVGRGRRMQGGDRNSGRPLGRLGNRPGTARA
jgi:glutathione synthase/RimK-type ligase-like ATP-grasp enzyme